jgi:hypothetical protein
MDGKWSRNSWVPVAWLTMVIRAGGFTLAIWGQPFPSTPKQKLFFPLLLKGRKGCRSIRLVSSKGFAKLIKVFLELGLKD